MIESVTLYKLGNNGKPYSWEIEVEDDKYRTITGTITGEQTVSAWTVAQPKNVGKSNETTGAEQAQLEAAAKIQKKKDEGYCETQAEIYRSTNPFKPMLAEKSQDFEAHYLGKCIAVQPKLDGMRCIANSFDMRTRNGKVIVGVPHLMEEIEVLLEHLPEGTRLDGELYNHAFHNRFEQLMSLCKKQKPSQQELLNARKYIQYHIYDICPPTPMSFSSRQILLRSAFQNAFIEHEQITEEEVLSEESMWCEFLQLVPTHWIMDEHSIIWTREEWQERFSLFYSMFMADNYEGIMIRLDTHYEQKRTKNLLKHKDASFMDDEFQIVEFLEGKGNRSNMVGKVVVRLKDGRTNEAGLRGDTTLFREWWEKKEEYVGKWAKVRFQGYTADKKLRFPVAVEIDREDHL